MEKITLMPLHYDRGNENVKNAVADIESHRTAEVVNGTLEKSESVEYLMREANLILQEYLEESGFESSFDIEELLEHTYTVDDNHVLLHTTTGEDIQFGLYAASYDAIADKLYLKGGEHGLESHGEVFTLRVLIHEMVHMYQKMYLRAFEAKSGRVHVQKRGGYHLDTRIHDVEGVINQSGKLGGLNEALTDFIAIRAIESAQILHPHSIPRLWNDSYSEEKRTFMAILGKISESEQKSFEEFEFEFAKGYIMGDMMHLRRVEKYFGKDSLKILALLGTYRLEDPNTRRLGDMIANYFEIDDEDARAEIAQTLLTNDQTEA
jgi:hypothetical protein